LAGSVGCKDIPKEVPFRCNKSGGGSKSPVAKQTISGTNSAIITGTNSGDRPRRTQTPVTTTVIKNPCPGQNNCNNHIPPAAPPPPPCSHNSCNNNLPPPPPITHPGCKCCSKELEGDSNLGLPVGHCLTKDPSNNKFFCYVDSLNSCPDAKSSRRYHNLYYSYQACWNQRASGFAAPEQDCDEDDTECWVKVLSNTSEDEVVAPTGCYCEDWDTQCFERCYSTPAVVSLEQP
jgi:hypothetical protein